MLLTICKKWADRLLEISTIGTIFSRICRSILRRIYANLFDGNRIKIFPNISDIDIEFILLAIVVKAP